MATEATSIEFIPNQPILFDYKELACHRFLDDGYCQLFQFEDDIFWQGIRQPCGENLLCDLDEEVLGVELVTNSDLSAGGSWTATNTTIGGGVCSFTGVANQYLAQTVTVSASRQYRFTYEVSSYTQGTLRSNILGDITAAGTYTGLVNTVAGQTSISVLFWGSITGETPFIGEITLVSIKEVSKCLSGEGWSYNEDDGYFYHEAGELDPLVPTSTPLSVANTYKIKVSTKLITAGYVTVVAGDQSFVVSDNGETSDYLYTGTSTTLRFMPSVDFDGAIKVEEIYTMTEIEEAYLTDSTGAEIVAITEFISYYKDRINLRFSFDEVINENPSINIREGCYRIALYDRCDFQYRQLIGNPTITGGSSTTPPSPWLVEIAGPLFNSDKITFDYTFGAAGTADSAIVYQDIEISASGDGNYQLSIDIPVYTNDTGGYLLAAIRDTTTNTNLAVNNFTASGLGQTWSFSLSGLDENHTYAIRIAARLSALAAGTKTIEADNITLNRIEPYDQLYLSNCLKIQDSVECSEYIQAYNDCSAFGFNFNGFRLALRVPVLQFNPVFPFKDNTYIYSSGEKSRTYAERDKKYTFKTDKMDDIAHSTMSLMVLCDHFFIADTEYYFDEKDYAPVWNSNGRQSTAFVRLELSEKTSVVYNNACDSCSTPIASGGECAEYCQTVIDTWDGVSAGTTAGWYATNTDGSLAYWNGSNWIAEAGCDDGIVIKTDDTPLYWNGSTWITWAEITSVSNSGTDLTIEATLPAGSYGRLEVSEDGGTTWDNIGVYRSAAIWYAGTDTFTSPVAPPGNIDIRIKFNLDGCTYYTKSQNYILT